MVSQNVVYQTEKVGHKKKLQLQIILNTCISIEKHIQKKYFSQI